jgi:hypothetical protein
LIPSGPSTTWIAPSAAPRRELTTRCSRLSSEAEYAVLDAELARMETGERSAA